MDVFLIMKKQSNQMNRDTKASFENTKCLTLHEMWEDSSSAKESAEIHEFESEEAENEEFNHEEDKEFNMEDNFGTYGFVSRNRDNRTNRVFVVVVVARMAVLGIKN